MFLFPLVSQGQPFLASERASTFYDFRNSFRQDAPDGLTVGGLALWRFGLVQCCSFSFATKWQYLGCEAVFDSFLSFEVL